jgi:hypothetical protein
VENYHMRGHRGLEGRTPFEMWAKVAKPGVPLPPSTRQLALSFGIKIKDRPITKHGITVAGYSFVSADLSKMRGFVGNRKLQVSVEQEEAGRVWVRIPDEHVDRIPDLDPGQKYLEVFNPALAGRLWVELFLSRKEVLELSKAQQKAGRPFRLESHRALLGPSETARKAAGIPADVKMIWRLKEYV